jgi:predicted small metal-binding protein
MDEEFMTAYPTTISGACEHCAWKALAGSYTEIVKMYQDHLRAEHPKAWMRS